MEEAVMRKKARFLVKVGLAVTLIVVGLSRVCWAQVSAHIEQWVLEQKWSQVHQALTAGDHAFNPVAPPRFRREGCPRLSWCSVPCRQWYNETLEDEPEGGAE
jgi:hypothetical protein